jgi:type IX secretion system PorP/SprF family membrane protein
MKKIIAILAILTSVMAWSQQETILSQYNHNMSIFNPAYVGVEDQLFVSGSIRRQWSGIDQSPVLNAVTFGMPVGNNLALGISVLNDETFIEKSNYVTIDASYKVQLTANYELFFGLKAGGQDYSANTEGLQTYNLISDPALGSFGNMLFNVGAGAYLKHDKWYVGLSTPRILNTNRIKEKEGFVASSSGKPHWYLTGGTEFTVIKESDIKLRPSTLIRYVDAAELSADFNAMVVFPKYIEVGALYRTDQTVGAMLNVKFGQYFTLGYVYEVAAEKQLARANNTSEFLLRFTLDKSKRDRKNKFDEF